jgi:hypothetical protein
VRPKDLTAERLARAVLVELNRAVWPPSVTVDFDGLDRVGMALAKMLGR